MKYIFLKSKFTWRKNSAHARQKQNNLFYRKKRGFSVLQWAEVTIVRVTDGLQLEERTVGFLVRKHSFPTGEFLSPLGIALSFPKDGIRKIKGQFGPHCEGIKITLEALQGFLSHVFTRCLFFFAYLVDMAL